MAQLFTVYFPKYYFDLQKEFSLELTFPLPFEYIIEEGGCYVSMVHYSQHNSADPYYWQNKGLQPGLHVIAINNISLIDDYNNNEEHNTHSHTDNDTILNEEAMEDLLAIGDTETFIIKFREEISPEDSSIPLLNTISPKQIDASSYRQGYDPFECSFNNPSSYWQPLINENTLNTWLRIDLGMKQIITKLLIQGNNDHSNYVKSFWIDSSDDCCEWKCHPLGEIRCKYKKPNDNKMQSSQSLHNLLGENNNNENNSYATIIIWPAITARFIRIRPCTIHSRVAIRLELYGFKSIHNKLASNLSFARVVTLYDVNELDRNKLIARVTNLPTNTKVIQIDCRLVISAALDRAGLLNVGFLESSNERDNFICIFTTCSSEQSERVLDELGRVGVGKEMGIISTAAITNVITSQEREKESKRESITFSESVKSRMIVKQVVERIMNSSQFTFDYICMLIVASMISVSGLATNNSVIVVASMLVSPLMGPVLAFTFGVTLRDYNMAKIGLKNELLSLFICIICGFIVGFFYALLSQNVNNWPTEQMSSRGTIEGLADGAFIAGASGVGVALSVLGDYLSTVVGVAISASLLPPAVNCGMLTSFVIFDQIYEEYIPINKRYINKKHLLTMAGWSLLLTIENIIIIFVISRFIFYIKNVYKLNNNNENKIWKSVTNYQRRNSNIPLPNINENNGLRRKESFKFAMDNFGMEEQSKVSKMINKHKRHKSLRDSVKKLSISIALQSENKLMHQQNKDNSHTKTHSDANIKCKKKHVSELFTPDIMQQYGYDMHSINDNFVANENDRFQ